MFSIFNPVFLASLVSCTGAEGGESGASGSALTGVLPLLIMMVLMVGMVLLMSVPQRKREKKVKEMLSSLKPGDRVRTIGGIYGTVTNIKDDVVTVSVGPDKARLVFARGAIATIEDAPVEATIDGDVRDVK
ncbi:MAG: preprotein translocase subunit YajC [Clostridia bacterium]|nr:preprotein translocase subunit YajC [Clostridia bacterium]